MILARLCTKAVIATPHHTHRLAVTVAQAAIAIVRQVPEITMITYPATAHQSVVTATRHSPLETYSTPHHSTNCSVIETLAPYSKSSASKFVLTKYSLATDTAHTHPDQGINILWLQGHVCWMVSVC